MLATMTDMPQAWGLILNYSTIIKFTLFNFIENQFTNTISREKWCG